MNDPRFMNTLARISPQLSVIAGGAAAVTVGAVTAPAWASIALAAGIGAVVTYAVSVGIDSLVDWLFKDEGKIDQSGFIDAGHDSSAGIQPGVAAWQGYVSTTNETLWGGDGAAVASQVNAINRANLGLAARVESCSLINYGTTWSCGAWGKAYWDTNGPNQACGKGTYWTGSSCLAYDFPTNQPAIKTSDLTVQEAIAQLPASDLEKPLNPVILAGLANKAWQQAASQPGYDGLPYPQSNPITQAEVQPWLQANPGHAPTVGDFVAPNPSSQSTSNPWVVPANPTAPSLNPVIPNAGTTNPAAGSPQLNLGADPAIGVPTLEQIPTAQQIVNPILQLGPDLRTFQANGQAGVCPRPTIELYGTHVLEAHCMLIENNKHVVQLAMAFAWAAMALFIVLSA